MNDAAVVDQIFSVEVLARFGHALSDPTRARVLIALREAGAYPTDLADLLGVTRTNLSNHLACLRGCGLVVAVPEGKRMRYELADGGLRRALDDLLGTILTGKLTDPADRLNGRLDDCPDEDGDGGHIMIT